MKWVDANRGDVENPDYRCRLVAEETRADKRQALFAATTPLEAKDFVFSLCASQDGVCLEFTDVARAYFH